MNLITYDNSIQRTCIGHPTLRTSAKGDFVINSSGASMLKLAKGDRIKLLQDKDRPQDWYIQKTSDPSGFLIGHTHGRGYTFRCMQLRRIIESSLGFRDETVSIRIGSPAVEGHYFPLITKLIKL